MLKVVEMSPPRRELAQSLASSATQQLPPNSYLTLVSTTKSLRKLEQKWHDLETNGVAPPTVFSSFDWVNAWADIYSTPNSPDEVYVLAGFQNNELVFLCPLMKNTVKGIVHLSWLTQPVGQYGDVLCARTHSVARWMEASITFLRKQTGVDILHLRHVRKSSAINTFAKEQLYDGKLYESAPWLDLSPFASVEAYEARLSRRQRKHRKNTRANIEALGPVNFEAIEESNAAQVAIDAALAEKRLWLKQQGRFSKVLIDTRHDQMLHLLAASQANTIKVDVTQLSAGGRPLSWEIGFRYQHVHYCYIVSRVNDLTDSSPGRLHFELSQRKTFDDGFKAYDLMIPYDPYKESWSSHAEAVNDYYLPLSPAGKVFGHVYLGVLRPLLRKLYMKLPVSALRFAKSVLPDSA